MADNEPDQPEDDGMELVMPFVVCQSKGGPYEDVAFAAGWQAGEIDRSLRIARVANVAVVEFPIVRAELVPQLELIGMRYDFGKITVEPTADTWCSVSLERS